MRVGRPQQQSLRIAIIYAAFGSLWIQFSDRAAVVLAPDPTTLLWINTIKGWFFVAVTALLLHILIRRQLRETEDAAARNAEAELARDRAEAQQTLAREAASAAVQRLTLASRAAGLATWELEIASGRLHCDAAMHALYRIAPGERANALEAWDACLHPEDREPNHARRLAAIAGRSEYHSQYRLLWPDGRCRHVESHGSVIHDQSGQPHRMVGICRDVTDRVVVERRLQLLAQHAGDVLWILDASSRRFTYISPAVENLRGYTSAEVLNQSLEECLTPGSIALVNEVLPQRLAAFIAGDITARTRIDEVEQFCRNGSTVWTEIVTTLTRNDTGGIDIVGITRDITQRRRIEQELRQSADHLRHAEEMSGTGHWRIDSNYQTFTISAGAARIYGLPLNQSFPVAEIRESTLPEYRKAVAEEMRALRAGEKPYDIVFRIRRPGTGTIVAIHARAEIDPVDGSIFGTIQDITERERTLADLRLATTRLNNAEQIAGIGHWTMDYGTGLATGSPGAKRIFGVNSDTLSVEKVVEATLPPYRALLQQAHLALEKERRPFDIIYEIRRPDTGQVITIRSIAHFDETLQCSFGVIQDITERRRSEETLRLQSAALAAAAHAIVITDAAGTIRWINPAFTALSGYTEAEALGRNLGHLVRSGYQPPEFYRALWSQILAGETWHGEIINRHKDGTLVAEEETITPVREVDGTIAHFIAIKQDITERRRLQELVLRSQRLESVGRLAGGIAHDLNNILAPILMAPTVLRETVGDAPSREILDTIETSANRGAAIVRQLLTFSRGSPGEQRTAVQLRHIVRDMVAITRETFPKNIHVRTDVPAEPWLVEADSTQLHQVLMNLCVNASDAMADGGTLTIALENITLDEAAVAGHPGAAPGPYVLLGVFDTGHGIAPEHLDKVFDPFFTTKEVGKGTGLGLATVLGILQSHHGFVTIQSQPNTGTQVRVYLPAKNASPTTSPQQPGAATGTPAGGNALILVVDDEESIRRLTRHILTRQGYRVVEAADGAEALALYQKNRAELRLVLTDLLMPIMDGPALIRAIRQLDPDLPIIAVSGHHAAEDPLADGASVSAFLPKPFQKNALLAAIAAAIPAR